VFKKYILLDLLRAAGHCGVDILPLTSGGEIDEDYKIIWLGQIAKGEACILSRLDHRSLGVTRRRTGNGGFGIRVAAALVQTLRPIFLPQTAAGDYVATPKRFILHPTPPGADRNAVGLLLAKMNWRCKALVPVRHCMDSWIIGAECDPPSNVLTFTSGDITIAPQETFAGRRNVSNKSSVGVNYSLNTVDYTQRVKLGGEDCKPIGGKQDERLDAIEATLADVKKHQHQQQVQHQKLDLKITEIAENTQQEVHRSFSQLDSKIEGSNKDLKDFIASMFRMNVTASASVSAPAGPQGAATTPGSSRQSSATRKVENGDQMDQVEDGRAAIRQKTGNEAANGEGGL
jgi:hypothetical protein